LPHYTELIGYYPACLPFTLPNLEHLLIREVWLQSGMYGSLYKHRNSCTKLESEEITYGFSLNPSPHRDVLIAKEFEQIEIDRNRNPQLGLFVDSNRKIVVFIHEDESSITIYNTVTAYNERIKYIIKWWAEGATKYLLPDNEIEHKEDLGECEEVLDKATLEDFDKNFYSESEVRDYVAEKENGKIEVACLAGRIDVVTDTDIIEVKVIYRWKDALGQVLAYKVFYPTRSPRIHLFGKLSTSYKEIIEKVCNVYGVVVTYSHIKHYEPKIML
jgi:hypothetical protein